VSLLAKKDFTELAESTRLAVQQHVVEQAALFDPNDTMPAHEAAQAFFAQLSGVITAAANGLAGALRFSDQATIEKLRAGLKSQFDDAFEQAIRMSSAANDRK
jgi:uncharacterized protein with beta-barrel porin domain